MYKRQAYSIGGVLAAAGVVLSLLYTGSALVSTAIGTLIPILSDADEMEGRLGTYLLAAGAVGSSQHLLELAIAHSKRRVQFGKPIAVNQAIQWMLADSAVEIHAARLMVYDAAAKMDRGTRASTEAAMVKVFASEMAGRVVDRVMQIHGGMGYMKESPVERAYRDARILRIYEGTSEVQRMIIAEELLKA